MHRRRGGRQGARQFYETPMSTPEVQLAARCMAGNLSAPCRVYNKRGSDDLTSRVTSEKKAVD